MFTLWKVLSQPISHVTSEEVCLYDTHETSQIIIVLTDRAVVSQSTIFVEIVINRLIAGRNNGHSRIVSSTLYSLKLFINELKKLVFFTAY